MKSANCLECSKPITPPRKKYCSDSCSSRYNHRHRSKILKRLKRQRIEADPNNVSLLQYTCSINNYEDIKHLLLTYFLGYKVPKSAAEIYRFIVSEGIDITYRTMFRHINRLVYDGVIAKKKHHDPTLQCGYVVAVNSHRKEDNYGTVNHNLATEKA